MRERERERRRRRRNQSLDIFGCAGLLVLLGDVAPGLASLVVNGLGDHH